MNQCEEAFKEWLKDRQKNSDEPCLPVQVYCSELLAFRNEEVDNAR